MDSIKTLLVAAGLSLSTMSGAGASSITYSAYDPADTTSFTLSCTFCSIYGYTESSGSTLDLDGISGTLLPADIGTAFNPVGGNGDPALTGEADEEAFMVDVASQFLGVTVTPNSYFKEDNGTGGLLDTLTGGDWYLWKAGNYAGVAYVSFATAASAWSFSGSAGLSHSAKISSTGGGFVEPPPVPVPATLPLLLGALGGAAFIARRRKSA
jgi:hypothetical protein